MASEPVEIELQSVFERRSLAGAGHYETPGRSRSKIRPAGLPDWQGLNNQEKSKL
jgi:hypothetical protein